LTEFLNNIFFIFQRISWLSVLDIILVTLIFFGLLYSLRDTQAMALLRGMILLVVALILLTSLVELPAFSWFARNSLPALLLALPVIWFNGLRLPQWTAAAKPAAAAGNAGMLIYVRDGGAGAVLQFSDGTSWINVA